MTAIVDPPAWTGVGSRFAPPELRPVFHQIAHAFAGAGWTLRSGGAQGCDTWCEEATPSGQCEIYLPWERFGGSTSSLVLSGPRISSQARVKALMLAESVHPAWSRCSDAAKKLHARNVFEVLGRDVVSPSRVVVCWTRGGAAVGGTATAIALAAMHGIEVLNLGATGMTEAAALARVQQIIEENPWA